MHAVLHWRAAIVALGVIGATAVLGSAQPRAARSLPAVPVDAYPSASRDDISAAYGRALAHPDDAQAVGALAMLLHAWYQFEAAAAAYGRAQGLSPEAVDWWYLGGLAAERLALHTDAVTQFERAAALQPGTPLVSLRLADARLASGDIDGAATLYRQIVSTPDVAAAAWYGLGRIHLRQRDHGRAREAFDKALALFPDFGAAHYAMAQLQRRAGDADAARQSLVRQQQCLACWPRPEDPWQARVAALRTDAGALIVRGIAVASARTAAANAEAIRLHEAALESDLTRGRAHVNLIDLYGRTGNAEQAHVHYLAALEERGYAADAHRAYGVVLLSLQRADEALPLFGKAVTLAPRDPLALQGQGQALEILGRPTDAARAYADALRAAPSTRAARFGLARISMRLQQVDEAIAHLEQLREPRDADAPRYLFALSVAYAQRGRVDAAIAAATDAIEVARQFGDTQTADLMEAELRKLQPAP